MDKVEMVKLMAEMFHSFADSLLASIETAETAAQPNDDIGQLEDYTVIIDPRAEEQTPAVPEEKPLTLEEVRAVLAAKSRSGYTAECKALIKKHGASKLSGLDPKEYPALLAEAEAL